MSIDPHDLIIAPVLSEKALMGIEDSRYGFYVRPGTNRIAATKALEEAFKADVVQTNMMKVRGKEKSQTQGRGLVGRTPDRLKAIVTLKAGQRIEQLDGLT